MSRSCCCSDCFYPLDIGSFKLSADGTRVALTLRVFPDCDSLECSAGRMAAARGPGKPSGQSYEALFVRHWDSWKDGTLTMLFAAALGPDFKTAEPVNVSRKVHANVTFQPGSNDEYEFSPDGSRLVFTARRADRSEAWSTNFDLYEAAVDGSGTPRNVTEQNHGWDAQPVFLANGDLAYLSMARPGFEADRFRIMLRDARTGVRRVLTQDWTGP